MNAILSIAVYYIFLLSKYRRMKIRTVLRQQDKLLEIYDAEHGFGLNLITNRLNNDSKSQQLDIYSTLIPNFDEISQLKTYFDNLEQMKSFIETPQRVRIKNEDSLQLYASHPIKIQQKFRIGQLALKKKQELQRQDFSYINQLCMQERALENSQLKSILLKLSKQLQVLTSRQCQQVPPPPLEPTHKNPSLSQYYSQQISSLQKIESTTTTAAQTMDFKQSFPMQDIENIRICLEKEMDLIRDVFAKKLEAVTLELQQFKLFVSEKINNQENNIKSALEKNNLIIAEQISQIKNEIEEIKNQQQGQDEDEQQFIEDLVVDESYLSMDFYVVSVGNVARNMVKVMLGDHTGIVEAFLPKLSVIKEGNIINIINFVVKNRKNHIQIQLQRGGDGLITLSEAQIESVNIYNNISEKPIQEE